MLPKFAPSLFMLPLVLTIGANLYFQNVLSNNSDCRLAPLVDATEYQTSNEKSFQFATQLAPGEFLIAGNIHTRHKIISPSGQVLTPLTSNISRSSDTWPHYFAYEARDHGKYQFEISRDRPLKNPPFSGMLPRICASYNSTAMTSIVPTASSYANTLILASSLFLLLITLLTRTKRLPLAFYCVSIGYFSFLFLSSLKANHNYDALLFKSSHAQDLLQCSVVVLLSLPLFVGLDGIFQSLKTRITIVMCFIAIVAGYFVFSKIRFLGISTYSLTVTFLPVLLSIRFISKRKFTEAFSMILFPLDAMTSLGIQPTDFPIISSWFPAIGGFYACTLWNSSAGAAFTLLSRQFLRINQLQLHSELLRKLQDNAHSILELDKKCISEFLNLLSKSFAAKNVSIAIAHKGEIFAYAYDSASNKFIERSPENALGVILNRAIIYGDNFYLDRISSSSIKLDQRFKEKIEYKTYDFFSCIPVKLNSTYVCAISLTGFRDEDLFAQNLFRSEIAGEIRATQISFSSALTEKKLKTNEIKDEIALEIKSQFSRWANQNFSSVEILQLYFDYLKSKFGISSLAYLLEDDSLGEVCSSNLTAGLVSSGIGIRPIKVGKLGENQSGPAVVALRERKSSLLSNLEGLQNVLHPETVRMLVAGNITALAAYPLSTTTKKLAVVLFFERETDSEFIQNIYSSHLDILYSIESLLDLADTQKENNAFSIITDRLVSDPALKTKIFNNSIDGSLPATIGHEEEGLLINLDLINSKDLDLDSEARANFLGKFFDYSLAVFRETFQTANVCKSTGDGLIIRIPYEGSNSLYSFMDLLKTIHKLRLFTLEKKINFRTCISSGKYFVGIVGTNSFGQIDVIGHNVDLVFRMEQHIKSIPLLANQPILALSESTLSKFSGADSSENLIFLSWMKKTGSICIYAPFKGDSALQKIPLIAA